ncbi:MAG: rRNA cytosine-C5-methyltransferase [Actinobacteria bacterium]|nr:rRNA cytosine-C5-methyltransferase [Actinomycetota bacterium]
MTSQPRGGNPRAVALRILARIEDDGAFANLVLTSELGRSHLEPRDRAFVTALVDGTTRMRRACDHLVDRFLNPTQLRRGLEPEVRRALRLGAFQLTYLATPAHAAVSATVAVAPRRARGLVNAVLRRVAADLVDPADPNCWPDEATRVGYPDWVVDRLRRDLGPADAAAALEAMNRPAPPSLRSDGYVQDEASQTVVDALEIRSGDLVVDLCAAPGGKATASGHGGARVIAADHTGGRAGLIVGNAERTGVADRLDVVVADGRRPPFRAGCADVVLLDAPCSGLGSLRRRADARWRITEADVDRLAALQRELVVTAAELVRPGGRLVYSVCTLTSAETVDVERHFRGVCRDFEPDRLGTPWQPFGATDAAVVRLLPSTGGADGMATFRYRRSSDR